MEAWGIALIVIGVIIVLIAVIFFSWWIGAANRIRKELVKIDEAASGIDVALTKRFDLLTKTVATVKGYAKHEQETLTAVIGMRRPASSASMAEKSEFSNAVTKAFDSINVVAEQYPDLKANTNFMALQNQIAEVEEQLQASRRVYNSNVSIYNQEIVVFPTSMVAHHYGFTKRDFFEAEASKREDVKIEF
ncbi:MAG: LemA family protein [Bacilli bacterium]|jgi:LemA protein|nr:LemA family protein [Bacilli bacterium]MCH4210905.1 LemA family protein [Bacilli bacterium]MCH4228116.1 LemA family protein [Bacilli bacterium]MCH4278382.1 LemA family protein [Bacilli bacterium]MCI2054578.1 LemA family protein [Bacilli bacterium]